MNRNLLAFAMSLALLLSAAAHAQTTQLKVTVPFDFTAGTLCFQPAITTFNPSALGEGTALSVHNVNSNAGTFVLSNFAADRRSPLPTPSWFSVATATSISSPKCGTGTTLTATDTDQLAANGVGKEPIEGRSRADSVAEVIMLAQFQFRPGEIS